MGNLVPALLSLPVGVVGACMMIQSGSLGGAGLIVLGLFPIVAWTAVNYFGLFENGRMRQEMELKLRAAHSDLSSSIYFVGIATPGYVSSLDPHEDVGFLIVNPLHLEFFGDKLNINVKKSVIAEVRFRPNVHTALGLGRWISVEGVAEGQPIRLMIEVRECPTLLANKRLSKKVLSTLQTWLEASK